MLTGYVIEKYNEMTGAVTCNRLTEEAEKRGIDLRILGIQDTRVTDGGIYNKGRLLAPCDFVICRYKPGRMKEAIGALAARCYNPMEAYSVYVNKYMQVCRLSSEGFRMPKYILATGACMYGEIAGILGAKFVAKGLESSQGEEVFLIENERDYAKMVHSFPLDKEYLFEEYISFSHGRDIRCYSIRGKVIACMTRTAKEGFRANVALGADVAPYPVTEYIKKAAEDIYAQTGLDFLGIDLLFGEEKPYFCEINVMPGLAGMERATGVNVAGAILDTIQSDFRSCGNGEGSEGLEA